MTFLLLLAIAGLGFFAVKTYNHLRTSSEDVKRARADVVATMKKRADIAQRLTDITAQYGEHEKLAHFTIGELSTDPGTVRQADNSIGLVVGEIRALATQYPDLKANQTYQLLMKQLDDLEERILAARMAYNAAVRVYNTDRSAFPQVLIAPHIGFPEAPYFDVDGDGLDRLASFRTDDGTLLREGMGRIANRLTRGGGTSVADRARANPGAADPATADSATADRRLPAAGESER